MKLFLFLVFLALIAGCQSGCQAIGLMPVAQHNAELAVIRKADQAIATEHIEWSAAIAQQPGAKPLPNLSTYTPEQRLSWYRSRDARKTELDSVLKPTP